MNTTSTSINIDNQPTELIKETQPKETKKSPPSGFSAWNGNEILNQKNEQLLENQHIIYNLKDQITKLTNDAQVAIERSQIYQNKLGQLTQSISDKYGVNDFNFKENMDQLDFSDFTKLEKSIIKVFESQKINYNKPSVTVDNNKKYKIYF